MDEYEMEDNEFECYGKIYIEVPDDIKNRSTSPCDKCDIGKIYDCVRLNDQGLIPECCSWMRSDGRNVHFVKKINKTN